MGSNERWNTCSVIEELARRSEPPYRNRMNHFGITGPKILGVRVPEIRKVAAAIGTDHDLAMKLWKTGIHEARILSPMIADPEKLSDEQMESMVVEVDSWDVCDNVCGELFAKSSLAEEKVFKWAGSKIEFVSRSAFVIIANFAVHAKSMPDSEFKPYLDLIVANAQGSENYAKKGMDWALRQIGKRSIALNKLARCVAEKLKGSGDRSAQWIGTNSLRELKSVKVMERLEKKGNMDN